LEGALSVAQHVAVKKNGFVRLKLTSTSIVASTLSHLNQVEKGEVSLKNHRLLDFRGP
jgi:hypothetical protein